DPTPEELTQLQQEFHFHSLAMEDVRKGRQRPKVDFYDDHFYLVCYALKYGEDATEFEACQLNVFVGERYVGTIHPHEIRAVSDALCRWEKGPPHREDGVGFLLYFLLDAVVDDYFPVLDAVDERIEVLEQALFTGEAEEEALREIFQL